MLRTDRSRLRPARGCGAPPPRTSVERAVRPDPPGRSGTLSADSVPYSYASTVVTLAHPSVESPGHGYVPPSATLPFPDGFRWGVATSANQVEGSTAVRQ